MVQKMRGGISANRFRLISEISCNVGLHITLRFMSRGGAPEPKSALNMGGGQISIGRLTNDAVKHRPHGGAVRVAGVHKKTCPPALWRCNTRVGFSRATLQSERLPHRLCALSY